jgi:hypothetical protein
MTNGLSKEFLEKSNKFLKICDYILTYPAVNSSLSGREIDQTALNVLFLYERFSEDIVEEFKQIWKKCDRDAEKVKKFIKLSFLENNAKDHTDASSHGEKKCFPIKKIREYGLILWSPFIKCTLDNVDYGLRSALHYVIQENPDPEFCKKVFVNVYSQEENLTYIANTLEQVYSNAEEFIEMFKLFNFDVIAFLRTILGVAERIENKLISVDDDIFITVLPKEPKDPNVTTINVTMH